MNSVDDDAPLVSMLVVSYKQHRLLARCLESVASATSQYATETIVVVNGVPLQPEHHAAEAAGAIVLHAPLNLGLPGGLHWARSRARGRYLAVVQDDVVVDDGWLGPLVATLDEDPTVGAAGSRILLIDGTPFSDGLVVTGRGRVELVEPSPDPDPRWAVDASFSASALVRAEAWDSVGGPNPRLFPTQYVDVDLGLRLAEADWSVLIARDSVVRHARNSSTATPLLRYLLQRNSRMVARAHPEVLADRPEEFPGPAAVAAWMEHLAEVAERRRRSPPPRRVSRSAVPLATLVRHARTDARRVRIGAALFPVRVALYHARATLRRLVRPAHR